MNSSEVRLTTDGVFKQDTTFVRADELAFTVLESAVQTRIMRLKLGDGVAAKLHPDATTSEFEATFTADALAYAFVQSKGNLNLKLVIRDAATGKDAVFDPGGGFAGVRRPSFHPKGDRVCFGIPAATGQEIASVGRDAKDRKTLTTGGINNWPAYSPDGKRIAFCSSRGGTLALHVMNADGSGVVRVGKLEGMQLRPSWSPDGARLVFTWNRDGVYSIHTIKLDGTELMPLTDSRERSDFAAWTPDGKAVVFVGERKGMFDLYRVGVG
jgi:Tol biopolymer transport system component